VYTEAYNNRRALSSSIEDEKGLLKVIASQKYDYASLTKKLRVYRVENSDFINVEFESESPALSAEVVNLLCNEFITYYAANTKDNELASVAYLNKLLEAKKDTLNRLILALKNYKIDNHVLNLSDQAKTLYSQIADFETRIELVKKDIMANEGAIRSIESKFDPKDRQYLQSKVVKLNLDIVQTKRMLELLTEQSVKNHFERGTMARIDSYKKVLTNQINELTDKYSGSTLASKENLIAQKLNIEINNELAKNSLSSLQSQLARLNQKLDKLVPNEAVIQAYEGDINTANQEYVELLKKYNQSSLEYNASVKVRVLEKAGPGELLPSKKVILVAVSAVCSLILCVLILFILFYLDNNLKTPQELANKTNFMVLGYLPVIKTVNNFDVSSLWTDSKKTPEMYEFKNQLRAIRYEIDNQMKEGQVLVCTSLTSKEGKTITSVSLAHAYTMIGKKVMHIDGNFSNPAKTDEHAATYYIEDYFTGRFNLPWSRDISDIFYFSNKGLDLSLFEIADEPTIIERLQQLRKEFDMIIIEATPLEQQSQSKEWIRIADKVLMVFDSNKPIGHAENQMIEYLKSLNAKFIGWVMNRVTEALPTLKK
ncbi:MAG: lipopolysaccharide biosynthesis protein, partial [Chitinophagia bacterium]|nr:lipopolysaccharide biosynthesis protein [Chitinophagia bacterium]